MPDLPGRSPSGACLGCGTLSRSVHYPGCWITESVLTKTPARVQSPEADRG